MNDQFTLSCFGGKEGITIRYFATIYEEHVHMRLAAQRGRGTMNSSSAPGVASAEHCDGKSLVKEQYAGLKGS